MADLSEYRQLIRQVIGAQVDASSWSHELIDEALRQALDMLTEQYPPLETSYTVVTAGRTQDLSSISGIQEIVALAWPWSTDVRFVDYEQPWARVGEFSVRFDGDSYPAAGEVIRVRYRQAYAVASLDGALTTTVLDSAQRHLTIGAAGYAGRIRLRQLSENPAVPANAVEDLRLVADELVGRFVDWLARLNSGSNPAWSNIGL